MLCIVLPGSLQENIVDPWLKWHIIYGNILIKLFSRNYMTVHYVIQNCFRFIIIWGEVKFILKIRVENMYK